MSRNIDIYHISTEQCTETIKKSQERKSAHLSTGCLKYKKVDIIIEKDKILDRWAEYISELFEDHREDYNVMKQNFAGPLVLKG